MKRLFLSTTALALAGSAAVAEVSISGSAEMGISGKKGEDAKLHRDIRVKFGLSGATDTGLSFGASADLHNAGKFRTDPSMSGAVHISGAFGTLTLGDTDGAFDKALSEVGSATAIADDHTSHDGYDGNSGLDGEVNSGNILRYDYSLGDITASISGAFAADDSSNSVLGVGVAWSGDVGGIGVGVGVGHQTQSSADASISGASVSVDMGNGISFVVNSSRKDMGGTQTSHNALGVAYTAGDLTIGVNGGQKKHKGATNRNDSGAGFAAVYSLGSGVAFQVGAGSGKEGETKGSSWSAGLAFSF